MPGLIRPARRPPGWIAPGPAPRVPFDAATLGPHDGEDLCYLAGDWRIFQRIDGHRWSLDDLITAWCATTALPASPQRHLDLGCGIGTVSLLLAWCFPAVSSLGVEAQALSIDLAARSIRWNGVDDRVRLVAADLRDPALLPPAQRFDLITGTPPYFPLGTASTSDRPQVTPAHIETRGGIEAYCTAAARWLTSDGRFVVCESASQNARVQAAAHTAQLFIRQRLDVVPRAGKAALFSVYTMSAAPGETAPPTAITIRDAAGQRTPDSAAVRTAMGMPP